METKKFSWRDAPDLMSRLTAAQNAITAPIDIMTFAGFCGTREQLLTHVERYEARAIEDAAKSVRRRKAA